MAAETTPYSHNLFFQTTGGQPITTRPLHACLAISQWRGTGTAVCVTTVVMPTPSIYRFVTCQNGLRLARSGDSLIRFCECAITTKNLIRVAALRPVPPSEGHRTTVFPAGNVQPDAAASHCHAPCGGNPLGNRQQIWKEISLREGLAVILAETTARVTQKCPVPPDTHTLAMTRTDR